MREWPKWSATYMSLGVAHLKAGNLDKAMENLSQAIELRPYDLLRKIPIVGSWRFRFLEKLRFFRPLPEGQLPRDIALSMQHYHYCEFDEVVSTMQKLTEYQSDEYAHAFAGLLTNNMLDQHHQKRIPSFGFGESRIGRALDTVFFLRKGHGVTKEELGQISEYHWQQMVHYLRQSPETRMELISETANEVYRLSPKPGFFLGVLVAKLNKSRKELEDELRITNAVEDILKPYKRYATIKPISIIPYNGSFAYIMYHEDGTVLFDEFQEGNVEHIDDALEYVRIFHSSVPQNMVSQEEINPYEKIDDKLKKINIPDNLRISILSNLTPVVESLRDSKKVPRKDPHPEQFIVTKGKLIGVDNEDRGLEYVACELVDLLAYGKYLDFETQKEKVARYCQESNLNPEEETLRFLNGIILRGLSLNTALAGRKTRQRTRRELQENMVSAVELIDREFPAYFGRYGREYERLREGLVMLIS